MRFAARLVVCGLLAALLLAAPDVVTGEEEAGEPGADAKDAAAVPDAEADPTELVAARDGEVAVLTDRNADATLREAKLALVRRGARVRWCVLWPAAVRTLALVRLVGTLACAPACCSAHACAGAGRVGCTGVRSCLLQCAPSPP